MGLSCQARLRRILREIDDILYTCFCSDNLTLKHHRLKKSPVSPFQSICAAIATRKWKGEDLFVKMMSKRRVVLIMTNRWFLYCIWYGFIYKSMWCYGGDCPDYAQPSSWTWSGQLDCICVLFNCWSTYFFSRNRISLWVEMGVVLTMFLAELAGFF